MMTSAQFLHCNVGTVFPISQHRKRFVKQPLLKCQARRLQLARCASAASAVTSEGEAVVVARKCALEDEELVPGKVLKGLVAEIRESGACIEIGASVQGMIDTNNISEVLQIGQDVEVEIMEVNLGNVELRMHDKEHVSPVPEPQGDTEAAQEILTRAQTEKEKEDESETRTEEPKAFPEGIIATGEKQLLVKDEDVVPGKVVVGRVTGVEAYGAFVDIGARFCGMVHLSTFGISYVTDVGDLVEVGQELEVKILSVDWEAERMRLQVHNPSAMLERAKIRRIVRVKDDELVPGKLLMGRVTKLAQHGAYLDVGASVAGNIHISQFKGTFLESVAEVVEIGQQVEVEVLDMDWSKMRLCLKPRDPAALLKEAMAKRVVVKDEELVPGKILKGKVKSFAHFGVFVDVGATMPGMIHVSQFGAPRVVKLEDEVDIGQELEVEVLEVDLQKKRLDLTFDQSVRRSIKVKNHELIPGHILTGKVVKIGNYGVFVDVGATLFGLIPHKNLRGYTVEDFKLFQEVQVQIQVVDLAAKIMNLLLCDPNGLKDEELVPGKVLTGKVMGVASYGVFVDVGAITRGLVHVSSMKEGTIVQEKFKKGQKVQVEIMEVELPETLTMRLFDPSGLINKTFKVRDEELVRHKILKGRVISVVPYGAFIDVGASIIGLLHKNKLADGETVEEVFKVGQQLRVEILDVNWMMRRIDFRRYNPKEDWRNVDFRKLGADNELNQPTKTKSKRQAKDVKDLEEILAASSERKADTKSSKTLEEILAASSERKADTKSSKTLEEILAASLERKADTESSEKLESEDEEAETGKDDLPMRTRLKSTGTYYRGQKLTGIVKSFTKYGCFVQLPPGKTKGHLYVREVHPYATRDKVKIEELLKIGQQVTVQIRGFVDGVPQLGRVMKHRVLQAEQEQQQKNKNKTPTKPFRAAFKENPALRKYLEARGRLEESESESEEMEQVEEEGDARISEEEVEAEREESEALV